MIYSDLTTNYAIKWILHVLSGIRCFVMNNIHFIIIMKWMLLCVAMVESWVDIFFCDVSTGNLLLWIIKVHLNISKFAYLDVYVKTQLWSIIILYEMYIICTNVLCKCLQI